ncbi:flagellar biosynthesis anti-sigma factor FlgM [Oceanospirillum sediminis]|uniref:Negative regulator of flagellin synthesis n=1 Tax=Oceanospirillum sediminis TaxID=2760088 RepID=A0A839IMT2_9GAMM|nr:flagellar biosynthesis anti-sigma factor FlgM [Oceanospirillum sediminis]MBB1485606.1 flagellar biosynthesis anti-sigma factor FlgM [Oceanospirillum sediminis]
MAIDMNSLSGGLQGGRVRNTGGTVNRDDVSKNTSPPPANQSSKEDSVRISDEAMRLSNSAQSSPEIDQDKVNAVKAAIDDGSFNIDYQALAKNIIQFESEL